MSRKLTCLPVLIALASCSLEHREIRPAELIHLVSGDSVLSLATGSQIYPNGDTALVYEYHPFVPLQDTLAIIAQARELWRSVRPKAESLGVRWVVMRATTKVTTLPVPGVVTFRNYGVVLQKHRNGWYALNDSTRLPDR